MDYQLTINQKRNYNKTQPARQKFCKGVCTALKNNPPYGKKYLTHVFCIRCGGSEDEDGVWMLKEAMKANGRCPCCNGFPRTKNYKQNDKVKVYY